MGGIICRAAFPYLKNLNAKFYTFLSLSSPHLGYMYKSSALVDTGLWFIKKWKKSKSLAQLSMTDSSNTEDTFMFKLS